MGCAWTGSRCAHRAPGGPRQGAGGALAVRRCAWAVGGIQSRIVVARGGPACGRPVLTKNTLGIENMHISSDIQPRSAAEHTATIEWLCEAGFVENHNVDLQDFLLDIYFGSIPTFLDFAFKVTDDQVFTILKITNNGITIPFDSENLAHIGCKNNGVVFIPMSNVLCVVATDRFSNNHLHQV
jgi:hypothetical protein